MATPGSYVYFQFPVKSLKRIDFSMRITDGPGSANVYWSNQFSFTNGVGGYAGMQTFRGAPDGGMFLFSVWNAVDAKPGSGGSYCKTFDGEGTGKTCRIKQRPIAGHTYDFRLTADGGNWFTVTVLDTTAGTSFTLGSIKTATPGDLSPNPFTWTEYFDWNDKTAMCASQPYSALAVTAPTGDGRQAKITGHKSSETCAGWTNVTVNGTQATQVNGIGNSVGGPLSQSGRCLSADRGTLSMAGCDASKSGQTWTAGSDGSLHPGSALGDCVTAGTPATVAKCTGATNQLWTYDHAAGTVTSRTGAPLNVNTAPGGWSVPKYMH